MSERDRNFDGLDPSSVLAGFVNFTTSPLLASLVTGGFRSDVLLRPQCSRAELGETPGVFLNNIDSWSGKPHWRALANEAFEKGVPLTIFGGEDITSFDFLAEGTRRLMNGSGAIPKSFLPLAHVQRGLESASPMLIRMGVGLLNLSPNTLGVLGQPARCIRPVLDTSPPEGCDPVQAEYLVRRGLPNSAAALSAFDQAASNKGSLLVVMAHPELPLSPESEDQPVLEMLMEWQAKLRKPFAAWVILQPQLSE
jgi:hypothetical protein